MSIALRFTRIVDEISRRVGLIAVWLVLFSALVSAFNAIFRYSVAAMISLERSIGGGVFGGMVWIYTHYSNVLSESVWYMFGGMVMLGGAWTLKMNEHVRVDLLYGAVSERTRTWIDLLGGLFFLMPLCILLIYFTWPWFLQAWNQNIQSNAAGGLPRWPVRLMLPVGFAVLMLQGVAEIVKCVLALTTNYVREFAYEKPVQ
ncbi:MAG: TRAP transporter small permease subunit [Candidatus Devosia phytovorans]|uniref:TRAP transporter small permease protein n=1 Tax=Candidatus Devosia phytovorans TaxID=3121372 RepID=A0AAJ5VTZ1_9HYPH|nr:TRAP transporter small permease subunit [Devosia sp.]WEK04766.1 MAG: TRAP transporter small permease subunit [Devosia sp.]